MKKVCVIGAGPSGMAFLSNVLREQEETSTEAPPEIEIQCFEKQKDLGGMWNFTYRTGIDEFGEPVHGGMFHDMWINVPKEVMEVSGYPFDEHFGRETPSYLTRPSILDYLKGAWGRPAVRRFIKFGRVVKSVVFDSSIDMFKVVVRDLETDVTLPEETFSHVVVATGMFGTPNNPAFDGFDAFPGRILHSHDIREFASFANRVVLVIGIRFSGEDVVLQCLKFGAKKVVLSHRSGQPYPWPERVAVHPILERVEGSRCVFKDGTEETDVDTIILCTGYVHHYPFMQEDLSLKSSPRPWIPNLYKAIVWTPEDREDVTDVNDDTPGRLMYLGTPYLVNIVQCIGLQAKWAAEVMLGKKTIPKRSQRIEDMRKMGQMAGEIKDIESWLLFEEQYAVEMGGDLRTWEKFSAMVRLIWGHKTASTASLLAYRDQCVESAHTGRKGLPSRKPFMENFDEAGQEIL